MRQLNPRSSAVKTGSCGCCGRSRRARCIAIRASSWRTRPRTNRSPRSEASFAWRRRTSPRSTRWSRRWRFKTGAGNIEHSTLNIARPGARLCEPQRCCMERDFESIRRSTRGRSCCGSQTRGPGQRLRKVEGLGHFVRAGGSRVLRLVLRTQPRSVGIRAQPSPEVFHA